MSKKKIKERVSFVESLALVPKKSYLVFAGLILVLFIQSLGFEYTYYDDIGLTRSKDLNLSNIKLIFQKGIFFFTGDVPAQEDTYYRPMQNVVYAIGNSIGGRKAPVHHFISMILHFIVSCLLFKFLIRLGYRNVVAFLATILFIIHPVLVQAVVWIPGVGELLITLFLLSAFIFLEKFLESDKISLIHWALSILSLLFALLSKESAIGFIPVVLLYAIIKSRSREKDYLKFIIYLAGIISVTALWFYMRQAAVGQYAAITMQAIIDSLSNNWKLFIYYIGQIFLPIKLGPLQLLSDSPILPGVICIILLAVSMIFIKEKRNLLLLLFGIAWYVAFLLPTLFLPDPTREFYSYNHRLYLPFIGLIVVVLEVFVFNTKIYSSKILKPVLGIYFSGFFLITIVYAGSYKNKYSFYEKAIASSPHSARMAERLGNIYYAENNCDKALELYQKAASISPTNHGYRGLVGNTYYHCVGDLPKAIEWYQKALAVDSTSKVAANTAICLGNIYYLSYKNNELGKYWFKRAAELDSGIAYPMESLGNILFSDQPDSSRYWFEKVLRIDSLSSVAWNGMGLTNYNQGRYKEGIYYFTRALQINPGEIELVKNLMLSYHELNDLNNTKKYADDYKSRGGIVPQDIAQYIGD